MGYSNCSRTTGRDPVFLAGLAVVLTSLASAGAEAFCFAEAGNRYGVAPELLRAIATQESALDATALNRNRDGTWDQGLMQINSRHRPTLARFGIGAAELWDPCTNVMTGAWVLADAIIRHGYSWDAVAAYNVGRFTPRNKPTRERYVRGVAKHLAGIRP